MGCCGLYSPRFIIACFAAMHAPLLCVYVNCTCSLPSRRAFLPFSQCVCTAAALENARLLLDKPPNTLWHNCLLCSIWVHIACKFATKLRMVKSAAGRATEQGTGPHYHVWHTPVHFIRPADSKMKPSTANTWWNAQTQLAENAAAARLAPVSASKADRTPAAL